YFSLSYYQNAQAAPPLHELIVIFVVILMMVLIVFMIIVVVMIVLAVVVFFPLLVFYISRTHSLAFIFFDITFRIVTVFKRNHVKAHRRFFLFIMYIGCVF